MRRAHRKNLAVLIKKQAVDAHLTVEAGPHLAVEVGRIDAVIDDVPVIIPRNADNTVMCSAVDFLSGVLLQHDRIGGHSDRTQGRGCGTIGDMIVGRPRVIHAPKEIIKAFAIEDIGSLAVGIVLQCATLGSEYANGSGIDTDHIEIQFSTINDFATGVNKKVLKKTKTKLTLKLKSKTIYYFRIRYTDGKGGCSSWVSKKVKTK